jgi:hypothetical protein
LHCILSNGLLGPVQHVHQFHDGGDAGVEVPAPLEVVADTLYGLVQLALDGARRRRQLGGNRLAPVGMFRLRIAYEEAVHAPQKSLNAFDAGVLPVEVTVGRGGEQAVEAGGIGAVARDHLIGRHNVAQVLRHFCPVFDHHALGE